MQTVNTSAHRRDHLALNSPAEMAIRRAVEVVEEAGTHPMLTEAVNLLSQAREKVADWIDLLVQRSVPAREIEDDVANLIERMIEVGIEREGPTERQKQQFRDALAKFVDERIAAALKQAKP